MKILFCSPYLDSSSVVKGGIQMWGNIIYNYSVEINSDVTLLPVSFDRKNYVNIHSGLFKRIFLGVKEYSSAAKEAIRVMDEENPDVIHICTSASISLTKDIILLRAAKKRGVKSVVHFHFGRIPDLIQKNNWEWKLLKHVAGLADICVTMDVKSYDFLRNKGFNTVYCPNPLSKTIIEQIEIEKDSIARVPGKIIFVGHVLPSKGVYELVNACKQLDEIELHIIGKAESQILSELKKIAAEKNDGAWCKFRGELSHEQVIRELMSASIFAFPSYTEGFPNVILEAMACGCSIVTTKVGAIPEMLDISNGCEYGICVDPQNTQVFYCGLKRMLSDQCYANTCAKNAELRVKEKYAVNVVWNQLVNIWKS